jgi:serine/threonine protein kinase
MSPERIQFQNFDGKAKYNSKCDVWSLGLLVYELASGNKLPYTINKKEPIMSVLMRIDNSNPPNL